MATGTHLPQLFLVLLFMLLRQGPISAATKSCVVYLGSHSHPPEAAPSPSSADELELCSRVTQSHRDFLGSFLGSRDDADAEDAMFYSYTRHINGFAETTEDGVAAEIAKHPSVASVFENRGKRLHTTRSWEFLGLEQDGGVISHGSIWKKARFGTDAIIGNLDTGVWPESKSSMGDGGYGRIPSKCRGICQNNVDHKFHCNSNAAPASPKPLLHFNEKIGRILESVNIILLVVTHWLQSLDECSTNLFQGHTTIKWIYYACQVLYTLAHVIDAMQLSSSQSIFWLAKIVFGSLGFELMLWTITSRIGWTLINGCVLVLALACTDFINLLKKFILPLDDNPLSEVVLEMV